MLSKVKTYALVTAVALLVLTSGASLYLWNRNVDLSYQLKVVKTQYEDSKKNLDLVSRQLAAERMLRADVEAVLSQLKDVPDETYSEELDPSIRNVLDGFHERLRSGDHTGG